MLQMVVDVDAVDELGFVRDFTEQLRCVQTAERALGDQHELPDHCRRHSARPSVWWDGCGERNCREGNPGYERGRALLTDELRCPQSAGP